MLNVCLNEQRMDCILQVKKPGPLFTDTEPCDLECSFSETSPPPTPYGQNQLWVRSQERVTLTSGLLSLKQKTHKLSQAFQAKRQERTILGDARRN